MIAKWYNLNPKTKGKILGNAIGIVIIGLIVYGIYFFASTQKAEEIVQIEEHKFIKSKGYYQSSIIHSPSC